MVLDESLVVWPKVVGGTTVKDGHEGGAGFCGSRNDGGVRGVADAGIGGSDQGVVEESSGHLVESR